MNNETTEFLINEDIDKYKPEVWKGLSANQILGACAVGVTAIAIFVLVNKLFMVPATIATWIAILLCAPVAMHYFFTVDGLSCSEFIRRKWNYAYTPGYAYDSASYRGVEKLINGEFEKDVASNQKKRKNKKQKESIEAEDRSYEKDMKLSTERNIMKDEWLEDELSDIEDYDEEDEKITPIYSSGNEYNDEQDAGDTMLIEDKALDIEQEQVNENYFNISEPKKLAENLDLTATAPLIFNEEEKGYCIKNKRTGRQHTLENGMKIGRNPSLVDIVISNIHVSGLHAQVYISDGSILIADLGSRNKTLVNGIAIHPERKTELQIGDVITFSDEEFVLERL